MTLPIFANRGAALAIDVELRSSPLSLTAQERATLMGAGGSACRIGTVSEAGGSGLNDILASGMSQLAAANATIAELQGRPR